MTSELLVPQSQIEAGAGDAGVLDLLRPDLGDLVQAVQPEPTIPLTLDTVPGDTGTTATIAVGGTLTGEIEISGDTDWYAVDLVAGRTYFFELEGKDNSKGTLRDPYLVLYDASGVKLADDDDNGSGRNSRLVFTATRTGRYFISAGGWPGQVEADDPRTGTYVLSMKIESLYTADAASARTATLPTDPTFISQWHLQSGSGGVNAAAVWPDYTGSGVRVAVLDQGVDFGHRDLDDVIDRDRSIIVSSNLPGGRPLRTEDNHGTAVAGVIAAERNGYGGVGVAYDSRIVALYDPLAGTLTGGLVNAYRAAAAGADVMNNSWGYGANFDSSPNGAFVGNFRSSAFRQAATELQTAARTGRSGLGVVIVQSAGNHRAVGDNTNYSNFQNNRFTITVAATNSQGLITSFSTPGASILVAAPGQGVITTDRDGTDGYNATDSVTMNGTSFSAPVVSGVAALMLEANPRLGYRDVARILALTAKRSDPGGSWFANGAADWNGGNMHYSTDYGFGLVDARAAVRLAETWTAQSTMANEAVAQGTLSVGGTIADNDLAGVSSQITLSNTVRVERLEIDVSITHRNIGDLTIALVSPTGATFTLFNQAGKTASRDGSTQDNINFTFGVAGALGQASGGTWTLRVIDNETGEAEKAESGTLVSWSLRAYGEQLTTNAYYVFTDEFAQLAAANSARTRLTDTDGGTDTINASAVTAGVEIDLSGATTSYINGTALTIQANVFEVVYGGDGVDLLTAGSNGARMGGGRGNDTIRGGSGFDEAVFLGRMSDYTVTTNADGSITVARDGDTDQVSNVERLVFADRAMALPGTSWQQRATGFALTSGGVGFTVRQVAMTPTTDPARGLLTSRIQINGADPVGLTATLKSGWRVGTVADIDGNGNQEIFFFGVDRVQGVGQGFGATWEVGADGRVTRTQVQIQMRRDGWEVAGAADVNGRVGDEILWQNTLTGEKAIWSDTNRDGVLDLGQVIATITASTEQRIVGTADMDGDGRREILIFDDRTRRLAVHFMQDQGDGTIAVTRTDTYASWETFQAAVAPRHGLTIFGLPPV